MLKEAMVPVNKGVVSYSQTFMLAQAFHKGFPLWSFPLYPRPTRMQTPSCGKRFTRKMRGKHCRTSFFFFSCKSKTWGSSDSQCAEWRAPLQVEQMDLKLPAFLLAFANLKQATLTCTNRQILGLLPFSAKSKNILTGCKDATLVHLSCLSGTTPRLTVTSQQVTYL